MWYIVAKEHADFLCHHGIAGQKKGVKRGPPYPLDSKHKGIGTYLSSSELPTVRLPKKEYAHVMSEIATNITQAQREQRVFSKNIGDYTYTVENGFDNTYRIIDKSKIR